MSRRLEHWLSTDEVGLIVGALRSTKGDQPATAAERALAARLEQNVNDDVAQTTAAAAERAKRQAAAEERGRNHALTDRQAEALAAVRAGKGPFWYVQKTTVGQSFRHSRSGGGATRRMVDFLIEEGLLTHKRELTATGRVRLDVYEQRHGQFTAESTQ